MIAKTNVCSTNDLASLMLVVIFIKRVCMLGHSVNHVFSENVVALDSRRKLKFIVAGMRNRHDIGLTERHHNSRRKIRRTRQELDEVANVMVF